MRNNLQRIHSIFLYGFFFALPWQTIWIIREVFFAGEKWQYGTIGIYISDILLFAWICLSIYLYQDKIISFVSNNHKLIFSTLLLSCWGFLSIFWSNDKMLATYFAIKLSFALDMFILIQIVPTSFKKISVALIASSIIQSLIGLYQFTTQSTFANTLIGTQYHNISWGGTATITIAHERWLRVYGAMPHPNMFGGLLVTAILLIFYLYITTAQKSLYQKVLLLSCISLLSINIIMTFSRTAWVTLFFSMIIFFLYQYIREKEFFHQYAPPLMVLFASMIFMIAVFLPLFFTRIAHDTTFIHNSFDDRKTYVTHALTLIKKHPLIGTGVGNYTNSIYHLQDHAKQIWYFQPVHNTYLLLCAELGMIGITLFMYFFFVVCTIIYPRIHLMKTLDVTIALIIFSVTFIALFDHWLWTSHFGLFIFFAFLGLLMKKKAATINIVTT